MADTIKQSDLDRLKQSVKDITDLSKDLRKTFSDITSATDVLSDDFKKIVQDAQANNNTAEKYLINQQLAKKIQSQINEFKSKSGYLDKTQLGFKRSEFELSKKIAMSQIRSLKNSNLDADAKRKSIDAVKTKIRLEQAELKVLESQVDDQNDIVKAMQKQLDIANQTNNATVKAPNLIDQAKNKLEEYYQKYKDIDIAQQGIILAFTAFTAIIKKGFDNFLKFDAAAANVRQTLGFFPGEMDLFRSNIRTVTIDLMDMGATFEDVAKTVNDISGQINGIVAQDKELLTTITALSKNFGITASTSAKFLKTMAGVSGQSVKSQTSMLGFSKELAKASGVPIDQLMQDVAEAGDNARIYAGRTAVELVKAAAGARMLGTNLESAARTADQLLNFESSINSELRASAILGRNINLDRARQLAFNKDTLGLSKEILRITKGIKFNELNPIQQKAYAEATGKTVAELQDMLQQEKNINQLRRSGTAEQRDLLNQYDELMRINQERAKSEGEIAEEQIRQRINQERMAQLQNKFNQLISELSGPVMDILEPMLDIAIKALPAIVKGIVPITGMFFGLIKTVGFLSESFAKVGTMVATLTKPFTYLAGVFPKIAGFAKLFFGTFGKALGPIGLVITAFQFIGSLFKNFSDFVKEDGLLIGGFKAVKVAIYDSILSPFVSAYNWIADWFGGKSPSKLGLSILKGIQSVSGLILDALTLPFRLFWNNTIARIPGVPELGAPSESLGMGGAGGGSAQQSIGGNDKLTEVISTGNQQIVAKIDELISALSNGGIAVNLDGVKVNYALQTSDINRGTYGQATF